MKRKTVGLTQETYLALDKWKSPGQSFDGAIRQLLQTRTDSTELEVEV